MAVVVEAHRDQVFKVQLMADDLCRPETIAGMTDDELISIKETYEYELNKRKGLSCLKPSEN